MFILVVVNSSNSLFFFSDFHCFGSNGSGKSSLAMASLWALTGSLDPRRSQDGKVSDIVNDDANVSKLSGDLPGLSSYRSHKEHAERKGHT